MIRDGRDEPVPRGLLQAFPHGVAPRLRPQLGLELAHQAIGRVEIPRGGERLQRRQDPFVLLRPRRLGDQAEHFVHRVGRRLHDLREPRLFFLIALLVHEPLALLLGEKCGV